MEYLHENSSTSNIEELGAFKYDIIVIYGNIRLPYFLRPESGLLLLNI